MVLEIRTHEVDTLTVAGFKLDKTLTIANLIQIVLLILAGGGIWLNGYLDRRDTRILVRTIQIQVDKIENSMQKHAENIGSHENRINVMEVRDDVMRERFTEFMVELREFNTELRKLPPHQRDVIR